MVEDPEAVRQQVWTYDQATATSEAGRRFGFGASEPAHAQAHIERSAFLPDLTPDEWRTIKLSRLLWHFDLKLPVAPTPALLHEAASAMERKAVAALRDAKSVRRIGKNEPAFTGMTIQDLAEYALKALFRHMQERFDAMADSERLELAEQIAGQLQALPPELQDRIRREAKLDDLSAGAFLRGGAVAAAGSALVGTVSLAGFAAYTTLTSTIAAIAGLFGLKLGFGFYVAATSMLATATSMTVLGPLALVGGIWLARKTTRSMRSGLVPFMIATSVMAQPTEHEARHALHAASEKLTARLEAAQLAAARRDMSDWRALGTTFWGLPFLPPSRGMHQ